MAETARPADRDLGAPKPKRPRRLRPFVAGSVAADVNTALRAEHESRGGPFGHALEAVLRRGLGLPPAPETAP